jgi:hypothetical protein
MDYGEIEPVMTGIQIDGRRRSMADNDKKVIKSLKTTIKETRKATELALKAAEAAEEALKAFENNEDNDNYAED